MTKNQKLLQKFLFQIMIIIDFSDFMLLDEHYRMPL